MTKKVEVKLSLLQSKRNVPALLTDISKVCNLQKQKY